MSKRLTFTFDDDAADLLLALAGSSKRQGEYLSNLIRQAAAERTNGQAALRQELGDIAGALSVAVARLRELAGQKHTKGGGA